MKSGILSVEIIKMSSTCLDGNIIVYLERLNTTCERPIMLEGEGLEEVESFRYLGSIVDTRGGTEADIKTIISKARAALHILRNLLKYKVICKTT